MKKFLFVLLLVAGCATNQPEQVLLKGYQTSSATVKATTALVQRSAISTADAQNVHTLGVTSKSVLDAGKEKLRVCRVAQVTNPKLSCNDAAATIDLGSGVLQQLETYLKSHEEVK